MKRLEIIIRQDRIVYTLLILTAAVGLAWVLWRHQHLAHRSPAPAEVPTPAVRR